MTTLHLLTIIAEENLAEELQELIINLGAKGYTTTPVGGKSIYRKRDNPWDGENIKIETIVSEENTQRILNLLEEKYLDRVGLIAFHCPVNVVRSSHFL
ncbi:MAG TPA: transcriptional regulator [Candidatus Sumerlaeota bacterium]|nr:transcriptional regulator [Candidatus Sumerlaeota bacterium]